MKESATFIAGCQTRSPGQLVFNKVCSFLMAFRERQGDGGGVCCGIRNQLMDILLIGW